MRLKIFSCHHLLPNYQIFAPLFQTLVSGVSLPEGANAISDLGGRNISTKQKFCELRHQYYVWRNLLADYDYVGFEHYRRPFYIDPLSVEDLEQKYPDLVSVRQDFARNRRGTKLEVNPDQFRMFNEMRENLTEAEQARLVRWITSHDILITEPIFENIESNFIQFHGHAEDLWKEFLLRASSNRHFKSVEHHFSLPINWSGYRNMYIMRAEFFDEYMEIVFSLLLELDAAYPDAPDRIWGHMSERLLGAFIVKKSIEMPLLRCRAIPHLHVPAWYLT
jgi:hypothetical protein